MVSTQRSYIHKKTCLQVCISFFQTPGVKWIIMPDIQLWLCANPRHFFWLPLVPWRSNSSPSLFQSRTVNLSLVSSDTNSRIFFLTAGNRSLNLTKEWLLVSFFSYEIFHITMQRPFSKNIFLWCWFLHIRTFIFLFISLNASLSTKTSTSKFLSREIPV